jgi:hypothetical protein
MEQFCGKNGSMTYVDTNFTCPEVTPYCFLCEGTSVICMATADGASEGCVLGASSKSSTNVSLTSNEASLDGCVVEGDMLFQVGQSIGYISSFCYNESMYASKESFCGTNGSIYDVDESFTCPKKTPYCFQCGEAAATCLKDATKASEECVLGGSGGISAKKSPASNETSLDVCVVEGDMVFQVGQSIGYRGYIGFLCYDKGTFAGKETFCGKNGSSYEVEKNLTCPETLPYCFQCGEEGYGAAICSSNFTAEKEGCIIGGSGSYTDKIITLNGTGIMSDLQNAADSYLGDASNTIESLFHKNTSNSTDGVLADIYSTAQDLMGSTTGSNATAAGRSNSATAAVSVAFSVHLDFLSVIVAVVGCSWSTIMIAMH